MVVVLIVFAVWMSGARKKDKAPALTDTRHLTDFYPGSSAGSRGFTPYVSDGNNRSSRSQSFSRQSFVHVSPLAERPSDAHDRRASLPRGSISDGGTRHSNRLSIASPSAPHGPGPGPSSGHGSVTTAVGRQSFRPGTNLAMQVQTKQLATDSGRRRLASQRLSIAPNEAL